MADFSALKTSIQNYIKQNGNEEITGNLLQQILLSMVSTLGDSAINDLVTALNAEIANRGNADTTLQGNINSEATARGNADTELGGRITTLQGVVNGIVANVENGYVYAGIATPSSTPTTGKVFYLALTAGTYTNFGATVVPQGINILKYSGSAWSLDSFLGLDDAPTQGSSNLVKSGGVLDSIIKDGSAFDLSAYNSGTTYADLSAALTALNALPAAYKKGGMSFKYAQTSDNKYVQYRLMSDSFNTTLANWQGVDDEPTSGSESLVKSGGVAESLLYTAGEEYLFNIIDGKWTDVGTGQRKWMVIPVNVYGGEECQIKANSSNASGINCLSDFNPVTGADAGVLYGRSVSANSEIVFDVPAGTKYIAILKTSYGTDRIPQKLIVGSVDIFKLPKENIFNLQTAVIELNKMNSMISDYLVTNQTKKQGWINENDGVWRDIDSGQRYYYIIEVSGGESYVCKVGTGNGYIGFLSAYNPVSDGNANLISGVTLNTSDISEHIGVVPSNARYLYVFAESYSSNRLPSLLIVDDKVLCGNLVEDHIRLINEIDEIKGQAKEIPVSFSNILSIAHQGGDWASSVKNTVSAFIQAKKNGFNYIETDIIFTSDGVGVISHDDVRTVYGTETQITISTSNWNDIKDLNFDTNGKSAKLNTVDEVLHTCALYGLSPCLEFKGGGGDEDVLKVIAKTKSYGIYEKSMFISFASIFFVNYFVPLGDSRVILNMLNTPTVQELKTSDAYAYHRNILEHTKEMYLSFYYGLEGITESYIREIGELGYKTILWTPDTESDYRYCLSMCPSAITSDFYRVEDFISFD